MNNKEFDQLVRNAAPEDLTEIDLDYAIEFYRYQARMERRYLGECMQLASRFKGCRIKLVKEFKAAEKAKEEAAEKAMEEEAENVIEATAENVIEATAENVIEATAENVIEATAENVIEATEKSE
jgi:hypothetical protein